MNIEVNLPWNDGDRRFCAALMATSRGVVRIGQQPVPYRVDPPPTIIPLNNPPEPTIRYTEVDARQTDLTPAQAELLADALEGDREASDALVPLGIQVAAGDMDQWFDDLPHTFVEYDGDFRADTSWYGVPEGLPEALRVLALITRSLTHTADTNGEPPVDEVTGHTNGSKTPPTSSPHGSATRTRTGANAAQRRTSPGEGRPRLLAA